jgi:hypothetical protein
VIRFWNSEVTGDLNAVLEQIYVEVHGSREAEALPLKHHRRRWTVTPPRRCAATQERALLVSASPGEGKKKPAS